MSFITEECTYAAHFEMSVDDEPIDPIGIRDKSFHHNLVYLRASLRNEN